MDYNYNNPPGQCAPKSEVNLLVTPSIKPFKTRPQTLNFSQMHLQQMKYSGLNNLNNCTDYVVPRNGYNWERQLSSQASDFNYIGSTAITRQEYFAGTPVHLSSLQSQFLQTELGHFQSDGSWPECPTLWTGRPTHFPKTNLPTPPGSAGCSPNTSYHLGKGEYGADVILGQKGLLYDGTYRHTGIMTEQSILPTSSVSPSRCEILWEGAVDPQRTGYSKRQRLVAKKVKNKIFHCTHCDRAFTRNGDLRRHEHTKHHGQNAPRNEPFNIDGKHSRAHARTCPNPNCNTLSRLDNLPKHVERRHPDVWRAIPEKNPHAIWYERCVDYYRRMSGAYRR